MLNGVFKIGVALLFLTSVPSLAQEALRDTRAPVGTAISVTPGQEFYAERQVERVPIIKLSEPFQSSMGGAMGLPFGFAIDTDTLVRTQMTADGSEYFVPLDGQFRAYHGLLGSVIDPGDTVGLIVYGHGEMRWFVDNSIHNGTSTIWTRAVRQRDPSITRMETERTIPTGEGFERLVYLGVEENGRAKIRHERRIGTDILRDEFTFPLDDQGRGMGAVRGAEFSIEAGPLRAVITVTKPMTDGLGEIRQ